VGGVAVALKVGELYSTISLDASKFNQGVAAAQKQIEGMTTKLSQMSLSWNKVDQQLARISNNMRRSGIAMSKALTAPLVAIGGVAVKAALDVDEALDIIARGTGAQGEALKGLEQEWRKLATSVTQSFEDSAKVIADYNTRLGLTGKALHDISKQALDASRMLNEDVNAIVSESAKAMQSWGVEAENMSGFLDKIFKASQDTGVGMSSLSSQLYYYGASLKAMGFDIDSSIALLAQFEREGVNTERIISAMAIGLRNMAQAGVADTNQAFIQLINTIQNAKTETEAIAIATKVFGRSGTEMAIAIREGKISVEEMVDALNKADGAIQRTADSTDSFDEKIVRVRRSIMLAIEPLGTEMLNIAESVIPTLQRKSEEFATSIANMSDSSRKAIVEFAGVLAVGGPLLIAISATINAIRNLGSVVMAVFVAANSPFGLAALAVGGLIAVLYEFDKVQKKLGTTPSTMRERLKYTERAGEIYAERHGKYPLTAPEYAELEKIVDELMAAEQKASTATTDLGNKVQQTVERVPEVAQISTTSINKLAKAGKDATSVYEKLAQQIEALAALSQYEQRYKGAPLPMPEFKRMEWDFGALEESRRIGQQVAEEMEKAAIAEQGVLNTINAIVDQVQYMNMPLEEAVMKLEAIKGSTEPLSDEWKRATDMIKQYRSELDETAKKSSELEIQSKLWANNLIEGLADAVVYGRNLSEVLSNILKQLASSLLQRFIWGILPIPGLKMHSGGVVGLAGTPMMVPAGTFIGAPRLHNGLAPDEFPAILQRGETVLPRGADTTSPTSVKIVNVLDPSIVGNYLGTAEGERVVVNIMQRNIRRLT
jgi:TP901 family phage tail tape measure protein